jgi:hypothetical protein
LTGAVLLGANATTLEFRMGDGNPMSWPGSPEFSANMDTDTGWYPMDMFYGIELGGTYALGDLSIGARLSTQIGSADFEETAFVGGLIAGNYTFFANDIDATLHYKTEYGTPFVGLGISIYEAWMYGEEQGTLNAAQYQYHFREGEWQWLKFLVGYRMKFKKGHYIALELAGVGLWSASLEAGFYFM